MFEHPRRNAMADTSKQPTATAPLPDGVTDLNYFRLRRRNRAGGVIDEYRLVTWVIGTHRLRATSPRAVSTARNSVRDRGRSAW
jgi:hypothetical protein